jgi:molecular chaperone IbpA
MEDMEMRTYDFATLGRSSIGFDRLFDLINNAELPEPTDTYPPYDIVRIGPDRFRISLAVPGFAPEHLRITAQQNLLTVAGEKAESKDQDYLFKGISSGAFERKFSLADYVEVARATCEDGLMQIELIRRIPETMKPRTVEIDSSVPKTLQPEPQEAT